MKRVLISGLLAAGLCSLAACSHDMKASSGPSAAAIDASNSETAESIHKRAFVLDAHADIEIPGHESRYVGPDGLSKVSPKKCGPVVSMR